MAGELAYPEPEGWDRLEDLLLAAISAVPGIGSPVEVLVERMIGPSLGRKREAFNRALLEAVIELQRRGINVASLPDDDAWVTAVTQAGRIALGTHLEEKLRMLKAAIVHAALPDAPADFLTMRFLGFVEALSPEHFLLLEYGSDPIAWYERKGIERETVSGARTYALERGGLGLAGAWQGLVISDLGREHLLDAGMLGGMVSAPSMYDRFTTDLGDQLLGFVTLYESANSSGPGGT